MANSPPASFGAPPPLPPGWTEHKAPTGHAYYYNKETGKSTYKRPLPQQDFFPHHPPALPPQPAGPLGSHPNADLFSPFEIKNHSPAPNAFPSHNPYPIQHNWGSENRRFQQQFDPQFQQQYQDRGGYRGGQRNFQDRRRQPEDRPKHRYDIPNCAPWVLVKTKLGRRFVWNKESNESFWKFPPHVMKGVVEFDRMEREKRERRERGEPSDDDMAELEEELAAAEEAEARGETVEVEREVETGDDSEFEEVEEVVEEYESEDEQPFKRQRTEEPPAEQPAELGEDDIDWQLAAMEQAFDDDEYEEEEEGLPLTEDDCKALFMELLDDTHTNPYRPWDKVLEDGHLFDDDRYKALPNMASRKSCFDEWSRTKIQFLKAQKAAQAKLDPKIPYLAFLHEKATKPKLYWPEFRRMYKKEPEMKNVKVSDKEKERLYREHVKRLTMSTAQLKSDLSSLLKAQSISKLNASTTLSTLPESILTDLRFISLPTGTRNDLVEAYISTLPPAPAGAAASAEEEEEAARKRAERERREKALADRERKVEEGKRKQARDLAYGKGRLREGEEEIERAMKVGKEGLRGHFAD